MVIESEVESYIMVGSALYDCRYYCCSYLGGDCGRFSLLARTALLFNLVLELSISDELLVFYAFDEILAQAPRKTKECC